MGYEGTVVLNYRLTKKLGEGGFGAVYLAEQVDLGRRAAIKILHPQYSREPTVVERFFREARAVCEIGHRAIVAIENFGTLTTGEPFYLMEFFPGGSLAQVTQERWLTSEQLIDTFDPVAEALTAAHDKHIVHRDLKPDNIMVRIAADRVADVRLLDFGIAKLLDGDAGGSFTGSAMGTPAFMPPEQALDAKNVDVRADVYSFGATVYAGICGRAPFEGTSTAAILIRVQTDTAPLLDTMRPAVPQELDAAVRRCLAKSRDHRPASIAEAWAVIREALGRSNLTATPGVASGEAPPTIPRNPNATPPPHSAPANAVPTPVPAAPIAPTVPPTKFEPVVPSTPMPMRPGPIPQSVPAQPPTVPEVERKRSRALPIAIVAGLGVVATVVTIVVASSGGSKPQTTDSGSVVASIDAAARVDLAVASIDAAAEPQVDAGAAVDAGVDVRQDAGITSSKPLLPTEVVARVTREGSRLEVCRTPNNDPRPIGLLILLDIDRAGAVTTARVQGTDDTIGGCVRDVVMRFKFHPSPTSGTFQVKFELHPPKGKPDKPPPATGCTEASFAAAGLTTESEIDAALGRLNACKTSLGAAYTRLQQALIQRKLQL